MALVLLGRLAIRRSTLRVLGPERVLLVGEAPVTQTLVRKMASHPAYGLDPVGVIVRDASGFPTGILKDAAMELVTRAIPKMTAEQRSKADIDRLAEVLTEALS